MFDSEEYPYADDRVDPDREVGQLAPTELLRAALYEVWREVQAENRLRRGGESPYYFEVRSELIDALKSILGIGQVLFLDRGVAMAPGTTHEEGWKAVDAVAHVNPDGSLIGFAIKRGDGKDA